jgi:hypothetical protein
MSSAEAGHLASPPEVDRLVGPGSRSVTVDVPSSRTLSQLRPPPHHHAVRYDLPHGRSERAALLRDPGGLCEDCHQLYIDPDLIELLDLREGRCVFAIESDRVVQEQAWSSAD